MEKRPPPDFPVDKEPPILTMERPLIIECAFPGWLPSSINPYIPNKPAEVSQELIESIDAGAAVIHVHPRDPQDGTGRTRHDVSLLIETMDPVLEQRPDVITWNHTWHGETNKPISYINKTAELLSYPNGNKYCHGSVVLIHPNPMEPNKPLSGSSESIKEGVVYLEEHGVKPIFQIYDTYGFAWLKHEILDPGIAKWKPFVCDIHMGKHHATPISHDPWALVQLLASIGNLKATVPDCIVGVFAGGRNWLPVTVHAIALGVDVVRVGMEDAFWIYPHRDDIIKKNSDVIRKVATIAREMGRDIATPADVRRICNMG